MTEYIDRTQEPDDVFEREVLARVDDPSLTPVPSSPIALLDQLDELRAKATPGPWGLDPDRIGGFDLLDADGEFIADRLGALMQSDAALIVGAVNAVGPLADAVRAVLAYCDKIDRAEYMPGLADTDVLRARITAALSVTP